MDTLKSEGQSPISIHPYGKVPAKIASDQGVQTPPRQVHVFGAGGFIQPGQLAGSLGGVGGLNACLAATFKKSLQPLVLE